MTLTVFHSGTISCTPAGVLTALAVRDERIAAFGPQAVALIPEADVVVNLDGGHLAPAFGDGHAHPLFGGLEEDGPQIRACRSVSDILDTVRAWAVKHPGTDWIVGASYDTTLAADGVFHAEWLDMAVSDRPVVLRGSDYHTVWVNSAALAAAGITAQTADPPMGRILRHPDRSPIGTLCEPGAVDLVLSCVPDTPVSEQVAALKRATERFAAAGVTWVQDAWVEIENLAPYLAAAEQNVLATRLNLAFRADPHNWRKQLADFTAARDLVESGASPMLEARTVKFFIDGIIESRTAVLLQPYADAPETCGLANWGASELTAAASAVDALGFQLHLHAIGDGAVRLVLDALEEVQKVNGPADRRPVIAHLQLVSKEDLSRFARLGVVANFTPLWAQLDDVMSLLTLPRLGPERSEHQFQIGTLDGLGVKVSFGSDWPVTHHHPMIGLATAVTRGNGELLPAGGWIPAERLSVARSLEAYSSGVAYQAFAEDDRGRLDAGLLADLVWLSKDPRSVDENQLAEIRVRGTWLAGRQTFTETATAMLIQEGVA